METINPSHIARRFAKACGTYNREAVAQQQICRNAAGYLSDILGSKHIDYALEIGCGTGGFTEYLQQICPSALWTLNDLCVESLEQARSFAKDNAIILAGDAELINWNSHFGLIASASSVQWFRNPKTWVADMSELQQEGDILFFTTFLPGTFAEIFSITSRGLDYPSVADWKEWLTPYYDIILLKDEDIVLAFDNPVDVLKHLKHTGVTATGNEFWTRTRLEEFCFSYNLHHKDSDGRVKLTYRPVYIACRRNKL